MKKLHSMHLAIAGLNLAAQAGSVPANSPIVESSHADQGLTADAASRIALEASWLKVPQACKDRSFSSDPIRIEMAQVTSEAESAHSFLDSLA